jgi:hypothetical protein
MTSKAPLFVELCAGLASVSLMLQGGKYARPPVSRMGNKHGYGLALLRIMGLRPGQGAERYLWCEPDPGCRALLHAYTDREVMQEAARIIRGWASEEPRSLWERLRAEGPIKARDPREVARWAQVVASNRLINISGATLRNTGAGGSTFASVESGFGTPADVTGQRFEDRAQTMPATVTNDARAVDPREVARWGVVHGRAWKSDPSHGFMERRMPDSPGKQGGDFRYPEDRPATEMVETPTLPATVTPDARAIEPADLPPGTVVYMDPPYRNTTGYGNGLPRSEVVALARRWAEAGARVYISEAEPIGALIADGWHEVEITSQRIGQKRTFSKQQREFVTCSHPPAWKPAEQADLFGC